MADRGRCAKESASPHDVNPCGALPEIRDLEMQEGPVKSIGHVLSDTSGLVRGGTLDMFR
jgi:hypothetical protein